MINDKSFFFLYLPQTDKTIKRLIFYEITIVTSHDKNDEPFTLVISKWYAKFILNFKTNYYVIRQYN